MKRRLSPSTAGGRLYTEQPGFSVLEAVLSSAVFAAFVTIFVGSYLYGQESTALAGARARATSLADEGLEAVRNIRDTNYANVTPGTYGLAVAGNQWTLSGLSDLTDIFTRQIFVAAIDADRKSVTSTVTWQQNALRTGSVSFVTELSNWRRLGVGNWAAPAQEGNLNASGAQDGLKVAVQGDYAYVVRDGGSPDFLIINVSNPASPSLSGSLVLSGTPQNIFVNGNYAYVASADNSEELQIIDVSNPASPFVAGTYNDAGSEDAQGVHVSGVTAYLVFGGGNEFVVVNVATPTAPALLGTLSLLGNANEVMVLGSYAYIASSADSEELQVVDVSVPASPSQVGSINLTGGDNALSIIGFGSTVVVGRGGSGNVHIISVATPLSPVLLGTFSAAGAVNDVALGNANAYIFIASNENSAEFQVVDISTPSSPVLVGSLNMSSDARGVAYHDDKDRAFLATESDSGELIIIMPQ